MEGGCLYPSGRLEHLGSFPVGRAVCFGFVETDVSPECAREKGCEVLTGK